MAAGVAASAASDPAHPDELLRADLGHRQGPGGGDRGRLHPAHLGEADGGELGLDVGPGALVPYEALAPGDPATAALAARLVPPPVPETPDDPPP